MEGKIVTARKRFSDEDVIRLLRQIAPKGIIKVETASGASVVEACRSTGVSDATSYGWRKKFGGVAEVSAYATDLGLG